MGFYQQRKSPSWLEMGFLEGKTDWLDWAAIYLADNQYNFTVNYHRAGIVDDDRIIFRIGRLQPDRVVFAVKEFERGFIGIC